MPWLRADGAFADRVCGGVLIDDPAVRFDPAGETAHQPVGLQQGAVLGVDTAEHTGCVDLFGRGAASSNRHCPWVPNSLGAIDGRFARAHCAWLRARETETRRGSIRSRSSRRDDVADLADRVVHRRLQIEGGAMEYSCSTRPSDTGKIEDAHPPLRPEAPKPAYSRSSRTTFSVGSACSR